MNELLDELADYEEELAEIEQEEWYAECPGCSGCMECLGLSWSDFV